MAPLLLLHILCVMCLTSLTCAGLYTNLFAVHIEGGEEKARSIAEKHGLQYDGKVMDDIYHITLRNINEHFHRHHLETREKLDLDSEVLWYEQQVPLKRVKRDLMFTDTEFRRQWYLHRPLGRRRSSSMSMNIQSAWSKGYTGKGVVVTILDDGIEMTHPDLYRNYDAEASWDINGRDSDPTPRYEFSNKNRLGLILEQLAMLWNAGYCRHGTRCAGEVAAVANNSFCAVGVAYEASIGGIRMLDGDVTDSVEAMSLSLNHNHIDIYSASWGPEDDGKTLSGPAVLASNAFRDGVLQGRHGKGSIFVWASGNGGEDHDDCNCDGYTNSIYTLTVSSATENGNIPPYSEVCSATLVSTYSSGDYYEKQMTTTDLRRGCTNQHTGTSASAPLAAGVIALVLQANPSLTWRDVQYISVLAASRGGLAADGWVTNGAGKEVSYHFGFGMMDASKMVDLASNWTNIPEQNICEVASLENNVAISAKHTVRLAVQTSGCSGTSNQVSYLEHVQAKISLSSSWRGDLQIYLTSPSGTKSTLLSRRVHDDSTDGFNEWAFLTTHNWGERSEGEWVLEISNGFTTGRAATLRKWTLILYGTTADPLKRDVQLNTASNSTTSSNTNFFKDVGCLDGLLFFKDQCVETCPDGYYPGTASRSGGVCLPCHHTCASCMGKNNSSCTECYHGSNLVNGDCVRMTEGNQIHAGTSFGWLNSWHQKDFYMAIYSAIAILSILIVILGVLVIYYMYSRHKTKSRYTANRARSQSNKDTTYSPINKDHGTKSKYSNQQELRELDEQIRPTSNPTVTITASTSSTRSCPTVQQLV